MLALIAALIRRVSVPWNCPFSRVRVTNSRQPFHNGKIQRQPDHLQLGSDFNPLRRPHLARAGDLRCLWSVELLIWLKFEVD